MKIKRCGINYPTKLYCSECNLLISRSKRARLFISCTYKCLIVWDVRSRISPMSLTSCSMIKDGINSFNITWVCLFFLLAVRVNYKNIEWRRSVHIELLTKFVGLDINCAWFNGKRLNLVNFRNWCQWQILAYEHPTLYVQMVS